MAEENDQTKWVGIRPAKDTDDVPVTFDGEVIHVIVDDG